MIRGLVQIGEQLLLPISKLCAMAPRRLQDEGSHDSFEHGERLAQLMGSDANEFLFRILRFFEQTHILIGDQGQWFPLAS